MNLTDRINADIKAAMLAKEKEKLEALRAVKSALLLMMTQEGGKKEITPEEEVRLLHKLIKQRRETAEVYLSQNRSDLADTETFQAGVISAYLPAQLSPEEVRGIVRAIITETGATSVRDMGRVMGLATSRLSGKADNRTISGIVKEILAE